MANKAPCWHAPLDPSKYLRVNIVIQRIIYHREDTNHRGVVSFMYTSTIGSPGASRAVPLGTWALVSFLIRRDSGDKVPY